MVSFWLAELSYVGGDLPTAKSHMLAGLDASMEKVTSSFDSGNENEAVAIASHRATIESAFDAAASTSRDGATAGYTVSADPISSVRSFMPPLISFLGGARIRAPPAQVWRAVHTRRRFSHYLAATLPAPQKRDEVILVHACDVESLSVALRHPSGQNFAIADPAHVDATDTKFGGKIGDSTLQNVQTDDVNDVCPICR